ncbi:hypothetical protein FEM21_05460 [Flavobacterium seoulense]|uniref:Uncharacterized protein n=1 Tax=Flavobacterium seoulense TaxID=1492738 RepID=A0A066WQP4_9FLAO|nr:hypothetical protein FEM21_05460 [Flavobacterium seoulense]
MYSGGINVKRKIFFEYEKQIMTFHFSPKTQTLKELKKLTKKHL